MTRGGLGRRYHSLWTGEAAAIILISLLSVYYTRAVGHWSGWIVGTYGLAACMAILGPGDRLVVLSAPYRAPAPPGSDHEVHSQLNSASVLMFARIRKSGFLLALSCVVFLVFSEPVEGQEDLRPVEPTASPAGEISSLSPSADRWVLDANRRQRIAVWYSNRRDPQEASTNRLTLGGALGGIAGLAGGALVSANAVDLGTALVAMPLGVSLGIPLGVHLANGARGSYSWALLASVGIAAAGLLVHTAVDEETSEDLIPLYVFAIPVGQLMASIGIERATSGTR